MNYIKLIYYAQLRLNSGKSKQETLEDLITYDKFVHSNLQLAKLVKYLPTKDSKHKAKLLNTVLLTLLSFSTALFIIAMVLIFLKSKSLVLGFAFVPILIGQAFFLYAIYKFDVRQYVKLLQHSLALALLCGILLYFNYYPGITLCQLAFSIAIIALVAAIFLKFKSNIAQRQETQVDKLGKSFTKTVYYFEEEDVLGAQGVIV